jgi:hypothetical protein
MQGPTVGHSYSFEHRVETTRTVAYPMENQGGQANPSAYYPPQPSPVIHLTPVFQPSDGTNAVRTSQARPMDPRPSRRLRSALKCLYATLSFSIPIHVFQLTRLWPPIKSYWLAPISSMLTIIFSSTIIMVTLRDLARWSSPRLPALCRIPTILSSLLIAILWMCSTAFTVKSMVAVILWPQRSLSWDDDRPSGDPILGSIQGACEAAQIGLLLAVAFKGSVERHYVPIQRDG